MSEPSVLLAADAKSVQQLRGGQMAPSVTVTAATAPATNGNGGDHYNPLVREVNIPKLASGACGFDLSRSKWDPYPWVSGIDKDSTAGATGLRVGDCVLEVNGEDILGLRIAEVAQLVRTKPHNVTLLLWTTGMDPRCNPDSLCCGPMPLNLERLSGCVQAILAALECPVCLDTIPPPAVQCQNGHLLCARCRDRSERCPVCRQRYLPGRSLIAEQVFNAITDAFKLRDEEGAATKMREQLFGAQCGRRLVIDGPPVETMKAAVQSHTHKFLARIMGKATSLDGLNRAAGGGSGGGGGTGAEKRVSREEATKQLSLSVNEIFRPNISAPGSRSTSPHRLIPDLGSQTFLGTRRPQSHNVSAESLHAALGAEELALRLALPHQLAKHSNQPAQHFTDTDLYCCPSGDSCDAKMLSGQLQQHCSDAHRVATICFGEAAAAVIDLPPRQPVDGAPLLLRADELDFWVRVHRADGEYLLAALAQASNGEAERYQLEVRVGVSNVGERIVSREIVSRCAVQSLRRKSWAEVVKGRDGIVIAGESITSTFGEQPVALTVVIKRI